MFCVPRRWAVVGSLAAPGLWRPPEPHWAHRSQPWSNSLSLWPSASASACRHPGPGAPVLIGTQRSPQCCPGSCIWKELGSSVCQAPQGSGFTAGSGTPGLPCAQTSPSPLPSSVSLPADLPRAGGATTSILLAPPPGWLPRHTGCLACQLGTLAKSSCLKPGFWPLFLSLVERSRQGSGGSQQEGSGARIWVEKIPGLALGRLRNGALGRAVEMTWPHCRIHDALQMAPFRIPATCSFIQQTLTGHLLCVRALCRDEKHRPLPLAGSQSLGRMRSE